MPWQRKEHVNRLGRLGRGGRVERALDDAGGAQGLRLDVRARACDREPGARYSGLRTVGQDPDRLVRRVVALPSCEQESLSRSA